MAQLFVGTDTPVTDMYGMKYEKQFVNTLEDCICECDAMNKLISDQENVEISQCVQNLLQLLMISQ